MSDWDDDLDTDLLLFGGRVCPACGRTLPANSEWFVSDKAQAGGLRASCRECRARRARERYAESETIRQHKREYHRGHAKRRRTHAS